MFRLWLDPAHASAARLDRAQRDFSERDRDVLDVAPHFTQLHNRALTRRRASPRRVAPNALLLVAPTTCDNRREMLAVAWEPIPIPAALTLLVILRSDVYVRRGIGDKRRGLVQNVSVRFRRRQQ